MSWRGTCVIEPPTKRPSTDPLPPQACGAGGLCECWAAYIPEGIGAGVVNCDSHGLHDVPSFVAVESAVIAVVAVVAVAAVVAVVVVVAVVAVMAMVAVIDGSGSGSMVESAVEPAVV